VTDISAAESDEVEQAVSALTTPADAGVVAPTAPSSCATVDNTTDTDGDFQPDDATYTFALPACSFTGFRGGMLEVTGTITLSDPTPDAPDLALVATLTDFAFKFTSPDQSRTCTAVRNGTRTLTGNAQGASLSNQVTVVCRSVCGVTSVPRPAAAQAERQLRRSFLTCEPPYSTTNCRVCFLARRK